MGVSCDSRNMEIIGSKSLCWSHSSTKRAAVAPRSLCTSTQPAESSRLMAHSRATRAQTPTATTLADASLRIPTMTISFRQEYPHTTPPSPPPLPPRPFPRARALPIPINSTHPPPAPQTQTTSPALPFFPGTPPAIPGGVSSETNGGVPLGDDDAVAGASLASQSGGSEASSTILSSPASPSPLYVSSLRFSDG